MNESMYDKGVYRTAPATPSLFIIKSRIVLICMPRKLYEYEIVAFERQVANLSPTVGVWSPYQRKVL